MSNIGRPRKEIDWVEFDKLCGIQCTLWEISSWFDCSEDTIERRVKEEHGVSFAEYYKQKSAKGLISLRRRGYQLALNGHPAVWIFHAKNYLGMADRQEIKQEISTSVDLEGFKFLEAKD